MLRKIDTTVVSRLLADSRLSDTARVIAMHVLTQEPDEDGFVPLAYDELRPILHGIPSSETVGRHVRMLEGCGWLDRRPGGRGNADRFRLDPARDTPLNIAPPSEPGPINNSPPLEPGSKIDSPHSQGGAKSPVGGDYRGGKKVEVVVEGRREPPLTPPLDRSGASGGGRDRGGFGPIDPRADEVIVRLADRLNGCRGALTDYLEHRVPQARQYGYVQSVVTWLDGGDPSVFRKPSGDRVPSDEVTGLLATAFNELLSTDEALMKRPVGDPGNLRTKISVLVQQRYADRPPRTASGSPKRSGAPAPSEPNPYTGDKSRRRGGTHA